MCSSDLDFVQAQVYFFIAPGYEEDFAVNCLVQMRLQGVGVALIGTTRGEMVGAQGVCIRPDLSLDHVEKKPLPQLLIIPGGEEGLRGLMIEPRLHRLVHSALQVGKKIALGKGAENFLSFKDIVVNARCKRQIIFQEGTRPDDFIQQLILCLTANSDPALPVYPDSTQIPQIG